MDRQHRAWTLVLKTYVETIIWLTDLRPESRSVGIVDERHHQRPSLEQSGHLFQYAYSCCGRPDWMPYGWHFDYHKGVLEES